MNPNCGLCRQPFKTGDKTVMVGTKIRAAVHMECKDIADGNNPDFQAGQAAACDAIREISDGLRKLPAKQLEARALPVAVPKFDSKLEQLYWLYLQSRLKIGEIRRVDHHCERLLLGEGAWYTPDFRIIATDDTIEMHETKGGFAREASIVRLKVAAALHPYRFYLVKNKGTATAPRWEQTRVGSCED